VSLRHALLGALAERPRTGYGLLRHFEESLSYAWPASHSQIYPELARMLEEGLISEKELGPRNSRTYAITSEGLQEVRRWLAETDPERRVRSDAILRTFFLWLLEPTDARAQVERELAYWQDVLDELEAIRSKPRGRSRKEHAYGLALEGGIRMTEARIDWLLWALEEVSSPAWRSARATAEEASSTPSASSG
jgi:PadR family transcriptional regulator, regulatory protein AphA